MKHGSKKQGAYCPFHPKHSTPNWCLLLIQRTLHGIGLQVRLPEMCFQHTVKDSFLFFETGSCNTAEDNLKHIILLVQSPKYWATGICHHNQLRLDLSTGFFVCLKMSLFLHQKLGLKKSKAETIKHTQTLIQTIQYKLKYKLFVERGKHPTITKKPLPMQGHLLGSLPDLLLVHFILKDACAVANCSSLVLTAVLSHDKTLNSCNWSFLLLPRNGGNAQIVYSLKHIRIKRNYWYYLKKERQKVK